MSKKTIYKIITENSLSKKFDEAVNEWDITDYIKCGKTKEKCICGEEEIDIGYKISNKFTNKELYPVGSTCLKLFRRKDINDKIIVVEMKYALYESIKEDLDRDYDKRYYSRKLIDSLYREGAFKGNIYNLGNGYNDYIFFLGVFNRKTIMIESEQKKARYIIETQIMPYLDKSLKYTEKSKGEIKASEQKYCFE